MIVGMALGYIILTTCYYNNVFNGRDLLWMSQSLFNDQGGSYNQSAILTPQNTLDPSKLDSVGLPRYTTTYAISQMCYNFSLGAAIVHVLLWNWRELSRAFGKMRFMQPLQDTDDPHYRGAYQRKSEKFFSNTKARHSEMKKYKEVPQWWYLVLLVGALVIGIGCSVRGRGLRYHCIISLLCSVQYDSGNWLLPAWSIVLFTIISGFIAICIGFSSSFLSSSYWIWTIDNWL